MKSPSATEFFVRAMWEFYTQGKAPTTYTHKGSTCILGFDTLEEYYLQVAVMSAEVDRLYYREFLATLN